MPKPIYIDSYNPNRKPAWILPAIITVAVLAIVLWMGPYLLGVLSNKITGDEQNGVNANLLYDTGDYAVITSQVADILFIGDLKSERMSQLLYNDVVKVIGRETYGYLFIETDDGMQGYVRIADTTAKTSSVEPDLYRYKLTIATKSKRVMSHASKGSILCEVYMGTVLFSDYEGDGIYRVALPDGSEGWIGSEGVIRTDSDGKVQVSNAKKFYETTLGFAGATFIKNGLTTFGASSTGVAYICAKINGVEIPRSLVGQSNSGAEVAVEFDSETGMPVIGNFSDGDLLFFRNELTDPEGVSNMGIYIGDDQVLMSLPSKNTVRIISLTANKDMAKSLVAARRLFIE